MNTSRNTLGKRFNCCRRLAQAEVDFPDVRLSDERLSDFSYLDSQACDLIRAARQMSLGCQLYEEHLCDPSIAGNVDDSLPAVRTTKVLRSEIIRQRLPSVPAFILLLVSLAQFEDAVGTLDRQSMTTIEEHQGRLIWIVVDKTGAHDQVNLR